MFNSDRHFTINLRSLPLFSSESRGTTDAWDARAGMSPVSGPDLRPMAAAMRPGHRPVTHRTDALPCHAITDLEMTQSGLRPKTGQIESGTVMGRQHQPQESKR